MKLFDKPLNFSKYFKHVVDWNATARNGQHDFSEKAMDFQLSLVEEEIEGKDELLDGYKKLDKVMVLDGLCDVFVTASYLYFQEQGDKDWNPHIEIKMPLESIDYLGQLQYSLKSLESGKAILKDVCALLYQFDGCVTKALDEVLASNDSKFPKVFTLKDMDIFYDHNGNETDPEVECRQIERRSEGRYTGVSYIIVGEGEERRFIFKSDKGKIVKPASFFEPDLAKYC